jgi:hypothetical protein
VESVRCSWACFLFAVPDEAILATKQWSAPQRILDLDIAEVVAQFQQESDSWVATIAFGNELVQK